MFILLYGAHLPEKYRFVVSLFSLSTMKIQLFQAGGLKRGIRSQTIMLDSYKINVLREDKFVLSIGASHTLYKMGFLM